MALPEKFRGLLGRYGPTGCLVVKHSLRLVAPEALVDLVVDLCEQVTDSPRRMGRPAPAVNAADQECISQLLGVLEGDLRPLLDAAAPLADLPEAMDRVLASLATGNAQVQRGLAQVADIVQGLERLEQGQREILEGVGQLGDAQAEQLAMQRQGLREQALIYGELGRLRLDLRGSLALIHTFQAAFQELLAGRFANARTGFERLQQEHPALAGPQVLLAAARGAEGDWTGAEAALAAAQRARPQDPTLTRLHSRLTRYTQVHTGRTATLTPGPGDRLGPWTVPACLGRGGFGQVLKAEGLWHGESRTVALKLVHAHLSGDPAFEERFKQEIGHLFRVQGTPGLVNLLSFDKDATFGCWYLVMDYVPGESLQTRLERSGAIPGSELAHLGARLAGALAKAHAQNVIHRDIKPANIILTRDDSPVLVDFGIARHDLAGASASTALNSYTALFAAPEQMRKGAASIASDIYSLAATLHYALLYDRSDCRDPDDYDPARVPDDWRAFFDTALATNPARRYRDMVAVRVVLEYLAGQVHPRGAPQPLARREKSASDARGHNAESTPAQSREVAVAGRRYVLHVDGTVTDTRTGLMWMRCCVGQTWDGATCRGEARKMDWF